MHPIPSVTLSKTTPSVVPGTPGPLLLFMDYWATSSALGCQPQKLFQLQTMNPTSSVSGIRPSDLRPKAPLLPSLFFLTGPGASSPLHPSPKSGPCLHFLRVWPRRAGTTLLTTISFWDQSLTPPAPQSRPRAR